MSNSPAVGGLITSCSTTDFVAANPSNADSGTDGKSGNGRCSTGVLLLRRSSYRSSTQPGPSGTGGAMPALETLRRHAGSVVGFSGVLNATSNFVLDRMSRGLSLAEAVKEAQAAGYAEADPRLDLDGTDAAQKLVILARAAFGRTPRRLVQEGIENVGDARGVRLVASCDASSAEVRPLKLPEDHPLTSTAGAENRLLVQLRDAPPLLLSATGAGRWPTAEAVLADLYDIASCKSQASPRRRVA